MKKLTAEKKILDIYIDKKNIIIKKLTPMDFRGAKLLQMYYVKIKLL